MSLPPDEFDRQRAEHTALSRELDDLRIELSTAIEHGDAIESQLADEIQERQILEAHLRTMMDDLERKNRETEAAYAKLNQANAQIIESIDYARKIQNAHLPDLEVLKDEVADIAVYWEPLDVVGGDYYWVERMGGQCAILMADCTGHGVPGAFMTLVAASAIEHIFHNEGQMEPAAILTRLDGMVRTRLHQDRSDASSDDGMDAALCLWNRDARTLCYAGAYLPLFYSFNGHVQDVKPSRTSLGYRSSHLREPIRDHVFSVVPGMVFYLMTDGIVDQVGGPSRRMLGRKRMMDIIASCQHLPVAQQMTHIKEGLASYRGEERRRDDMTLIIFQPL